MSELATKVIGLVGHPVEVEHRPLPLDDPPQRRPDLSRAEAVLDWKPAVSLNEGLAVTVDYFRKLGFLQPSPEPECHRPWSGTARHGVADRQAGHAHGSAVRVHRDLDLSPTAPEKVPARSAGRARCPR